MYDWDERKYDPDVDDDWDLPSWSDSDDGREGYQLGMLRLKLKGHEEREIAPPLAGLPHRCGTWIIGGRANVEALIHDLEAALKYLP